MAHRKCSREGRRKQKKEEEFICFSLHAFNVAPQEGKTLMPDMTKAWKVKDARMCWTFEKPLGRPGTTF